MEKIKKIDELYRELNELNEVSKEYLDEFVKNNDNNINSIKEYDNDLNRNIDLYQARIYDLAQYKITKELLNKIKNN
jgi:hemerythrin-like domain-containing protein